MSTRSRTILAIGITIFFWSAAFAGIRAGLTGYSPGAVALFRFLVASTLLGIYAGLTRMRLPDKRDIPAIIGIAFVGIVVYHVALNYGEISVTAAVASFLINFAPVFTALLATLFLGERLKAWGWVGVAISFSGVALIAFAKGDGLHFEPGALLVLLSALTQAVYFVVQKPYLKKYSAFQLTTYTIWASALMLLVFAPNLIEEAPHAGLDATLAVVFLGVFPSAVAYVAWSYALSKIPASKVVSFLYLVPPSVIVIAWLWLGEVPPAISLVGGFIALSGVVLVNTKGREH